MSDSLIARLDVALRERRPDYYARLRPGASDERLAALEQALGAALPDAFRRLYRWRDGQDESYFAGLVGNRSWMTLEAVTSSWRLLTEMQEGGEFAEAHWWRREWVPFLENGGGDHLCLDVAGTGGGVPGQLVEFWHADSDRAITFGSLEQWLETLVVALESGYRNLSYDGPEGFAAHERGRGDLRTRLPVRQSRRPAAARGKRVLMPDYGAPTHYKEDLPLAFPDLTLVF